MVKRRKTAGELSLKAARDSTKYDPLEVGYALTDDVLQQLQICGARHASVFNEDEYCLILVIAEDPLIKGVRRHKYAAFLYLPMPRPNQSVYLYNKHTQTIKRLWSMPNALVMAKMSDMSTVAPKWKLTKGWCDAFYHGWKREGLKMINTTPSYFFDYIRKQHGISLLSETEYLNANREELIKAGGKVTDSLPTEAFDFSKVSVDKIVDTNTAIAE